MSMRIIILMSLLIAFEYSFAKCTEDSTRIVVYNTSYNVLHLQAKDEHTCKLHNIARVRPGIKGKYCIKHDYLLKITTMSLKGNTRLAITATDLWNDLIISTPKDQIPDVELHHIYNKDKQKLLFKEENLIDNDDLKKTLKSQRESGNSISNKTKVKNIPKSENDLNNNFLDMEKMERKKIAEEFKNLFK